MNDNLTRHTILRNLLNISNGEGYNDKSLLVPYSDVYEKSKILIKKSEFNRITYALIIENYINIQPDENGKKWLCLSDKGLHATITGYFLRENKKLTSKIWNSGLMVGANIIVALCTLITLISTCNSSQNDMRNIGKRVDSLQTQLNELRQKNQPKNTNDSPSIYVK